MTTGPTLILAVDPGHTESAWVAYDPAAGRLADFGKCHNEELLDQLGPDGSLFSDRRRLIVEQIASYGMAVGAEVFETVFWSGRFCQAWAAQGGQWERLKRLPVKMNLCKDSRAKDGNIRQALLDRFGGKAVAVGKKHSPGPLYGVSGDVWAALAVAVTWADLHCAVSAVWTPGPALVAAEGGRP